MYLFKIIVTSLCFITVILCTILKVFVLYSCNLLSMYDEIVYDMLANVNGIYYVHVCEQAR